MRKAPVLPTLVLPLALLFGCGGGSENNANSQATQGSQKSEPDIRGVQTDPVDPMQAAADAMAQEFGDSLQAAFDEQAKIQEQGGTPEQIAEAHARFDSVVAVDETEVTALWMAPEGLEQMPVGEAIDVLVEGSGISIDPGALSEHWNAQTPVSTDGMSRAQAIDAIASHFDVAAEFPVPNPWTNHLNGGEENTITFAADISVMPVTHSGPFRIAATKTEEHAPYGVGKVSARAHAIGLSDSVLATNASVAEWFSIDSAVNDEGNSLLAQENVTRLTQPNQAGRLFAVDANVDLARLVRSVQSIQTLSGQVQLQLPVEVHEVTFSGDAPSIKTVGGIVVHLKRSGTDNEIEAAVGENANYEILWAPEFADGSPMGIVHNSSYDFNGSLSASIQTPEKPARIRIKLIRAQALEFDFELSGIPMGGYSEQPEKLEKLAFDAQQPVSVVFSEFVSREGDFPKINLRSVNHSNKDVKSVQAKLIYLDAENKQVGDCFTTLMPSSFGNGLPIYIKSGESDTMEQTAFFMPDNTDTIQVSVQKVDFMDYSTWEAPQ